MKFKKALSVILMLALTLSSFAAMGGFAVNAIESTNLVTNGGFDSDTNGWSVTAGTLESVANPASGGLNSKFASGNVAKFTAKASWMYQAVQLEKGEYTLQFNAYTDGGKLFFGVYNSNDFTTDTVIKYTAYSSVNPNGDVITTNNGFGHSDVPCAYYEAGNANREIKYTFVLEEKTTVYIALKAYTDKTLYLDNVSLEKVNTELVNGDFENGTTGWSVTPEDGATLTAEELTATNALAEGKAAKLVNNGKTAWMYQAIKLKAGTYTWEFTTDTKSTVQIAGNYIVGVYNSSTFNNNSLIQGTVQYQPKGYTTWNALGYRSSNGDYMGDGGSNRYNKYTFVLDEETVVYLALRSNATNGATLYADNMTLTLKKELDTTVYDFDENGQFDDSFVVSDANQSSDTMKIETKASGEEDHGNVLVLPKYSGTKDADRPASARFYKALEGLETGKTYKISFDLKMGYSGFASEWLGLAGVRNSSLRDNGSDMLTVENTFDAFGGTPKKFVAYTKDEAYTITQNPNNFRNAVIMWNGGTGWATYTMEFVAESDTYFFWLENYLGKADMLVDNIQFSAIDSFSGEIDNSIIKDSSVKSVLVIGNSFAGDTIYEMQKVLDATESNVLRVGKFGKGAQTASYFASIIEKDIYGADFCYAEKGYKGERTVNAYTSFDEVKDFTTWDYVLVQAATDNYSDDYRKQVANLVDALVAKGFSKEQIYLYVPWASRQDYLDGNNNIYNTTATQITALNTYVENLKNDESLEGCTVISVYDELYSFSKYVDNIHRGTYGVNDGLHLNKLGQTALSMVLLNKLADVDTTALDFDETDYTDSEWSDNDGGTITDVQLRAMKKIANGDEDAGVAQGDANYDDSVDIRDMIRIKKLTANSKYTAGGDCDSDGNLDAEDLASLRKFLLFGNWTDNDANANSISLVD